jgi:hypothetical protein
MPSKAEQFRDAMAARPEFHAHGSTMVLAHVDDEGKLRFDVSRLSHAAALELAAWIHATFGERTP